MSSQEIDNRLNDLPFVPFRLFVSNGETYGVGHPDVIMVGLASVTLSIPIPMDGDTPRERNVTISLFHVVKIEPLATATSDQS